ncbi:WXG100 family type VII secretion target [Microbacterium sp. SORGH_AS428]|uniref:WXG100 family type VII secretion target n=1 Tax=Microbacterium sp. SORGH_AS_0428 TaxID=3041788 RepID=UPI0028587AC1|nr:WXG100 family type VII secretion target [Microbacterium sp. SORGH_AS_0428]MDR6200880.1 WXG100 family type VII secretion target [Microbacterium sp. SORGH_AS_0428]
MAYRAHIAQLTDVVEELERIANEIAEVHANADAASRRLHSTWEGEASQAHTTAHSAWSADAREMNQALVAMRQLLAGAQANYAAAVEANTRMWG